MRLIIGIYTSYSTYGKLGSRWGLVVVQCGVDKRIAIQSDKLESGKVLWRYGLTPATLCITLQEAFKFIAEIRQSIIDKVKRPLTSRPALCLHEGVTRFARKETLLHLHFVLCFRSTSG